MHPKIGRMAAFATTALTLTSLGVATSSTAAHHTPTTVDLPAPVLPGAGPTARVQQQQEKPVEPQPTATQPAPTQVPPTKVPPVQPTATQTPVEPEKAEQEKQDPGNANPIRRFADKLPISEEQIDKLLKILDWVLRMMGQNPPGGGDKTPAPTPTTTTPAPAPTTTTPAPAPTTTTPAPGAPAPTNAPGAPGGGAPAPTNAPGAAPAPGGGNLDAELQKVIDMVNAERQKGGAQPLAHDECLSAKIAQTWAVEMARTGNFNHQPLNDVGSKCPDFRYAAENIAMGQRDAAAVMDSWMKSSGHRQNIMNQSYTHIGVGLAKNSQGSPYWVQNFSAKSNR